MINILSILNMMRMTITRRPSTSDMMVSYLTAYMLSRSCTNSSVRRTAHTDEHDGEVTNDNGGCDILVGAAVADGDAIS